MNSKPINRAYELISDFYGTKRAKRSRVPLINHIDEGILILEDLGASFYALEAYCLHPIVQDSEVLKDHWKEIVRQNTETVLLAMEYRYRANSWLCGMKKPEVPLSTFLDVNLMLFADKVQNRKDFETYHKGRIENSNALTAYFNEWLNVLGADESKYQYYCNLIDKNKK